MRKNNFLTLEEFYSVSRLIQECANRLITESAKAMPRTKDYPNPYHDEEKIQKLMQCYESSTYALDANENYKAYVRNQVEVKLSKVLALKANRYERIKILLPFVFYSLVVLNEADTVKAKRRRNRFQKSRKVEKAPVNWRQSNPYQQWTTIYRPYDGDTELENEILILSERAYEKDYYRNPFMCDSAKAISQEMHNLNGSLHYLRCLSDMAGAGVFLHDVLVTMADDNYPLDTILQMTCVMHFQKVLNVCRLITDENKAVYIDGRLTFKRYESQNIVEEYTFEKLGHNIQTIEDYASKHFFPICFKNERTDGLVEAFMSGIEKKNFITIYRFLSDNFQYNFPGLIEMFINREKLQPFINADSVFCAYLDAQKELISLLPRINVCTSNLNNLLKSVETVINCRDVLSTQSYISKYRTKEEEQQAKCQQEEDLKQNELAIHSSTYDTMEWDCFFDDSYDYKGGDYHEDEEAMDQWQQLEDELYEMVYEFNYQKRDLVRDPEQGDYLRKLIQEKISIVKESK